MKRLIAIILGLAVSAAVLTGCGQKALAPEGADNTPVMVIPTKPVEIMMTDGGITVNGSLITGDKTAAVYAANDIVYYEAGKDFTYGEGTEADAHSTEEAAAHTVVHITEPGTYELSGTLTHGQVAVDLGQEAGEDPDAVVTLVLNGVDITCQVAPAVIFYNVYECGSTDTEAAGWDVDTMSAGANVVIADGTVNNIEGAYVARIYKPDTVELSEDGTEVAEAKKLHKYDAAFYSKMSMNISGGSKGDGILNIVAANEGLDSELHLTIHGGNINIFSGNDGINTNEDGVSVTTINGGNLAITVTGETGEGDGIDSNGWLVINAGTVTAAACSASMDAGIDSDMGIHINGGTVTATGHMLDRIEEGGQNYAVFSFRETQTGGTGYTLTDLGSSDVADFTPVNDFSILLFSSEDISAATYALKQGDTRLYHGGTGMGGGFGGMMPGGERPEGMKEFDPDRVGEWPEGAMHPPVGMERPGGMVQPDGNDGGWKPEPNEDGTITLPDGTVIDPEKMEPRPGGMGDFGGREEFPGMGGETAVERSDLFEIKAGANYFSNISAAEEPD